MCALLHSVVMNNLAAPGALSRISRDYGIVCLVVCINAGAVIFVSTFDIVYYDIHKINVTAIK